MIGPSRRIELKTTDQFRTMRRAGLVVAEALRSVAAEVRAGVTTRELDAIAAEVIRSHGAESSFLDYGAVDGVGGFAGVSCISVNDEVVHGVPGSRLLADGDLVSIDCGAIVDGWHGDSALSVFVGEPGPDAVALSEVTRQAMWQGIAAIRPGRQISDISTAIETFVRGAGPAYAIVEDYVGHGIGSQMHQPPDVPNVVARSFLRPNGKPARSPKIVAGMALAVEPMIALGDSASHTLDDDWTVVTDDGSLACHWEHTVAITERGLWVLTEPDGGEALLAAFDAPFAPLAD